MSSVAPNIAPAIDASGGQPIKFASNQITKSYKLIIAGSVFMFSGFTTSIVMAAAKSSSQASIYLPLSLEALGSGLMIFGGVNLLKTGKNIKLQSRRPQLHLQYFGTGGGLQLRF